jgi:ATP-dependent Clp protease adapter protein ClpS
MYDSTHITQLIKAAAHKHGFASCGIAKADFLEEDAKQLELMVEAR